MEPIIWLGILAVLLVIEGLTTALTTIWFAGGALAAAIAIWYWSWNCASASSVFWCFSCASDFHKTGSHEAYE